MSQNLISLTVMLGLIGLATLLAYCKASPRQIAPAPVVDQEAARREIELVLAERPFGLTQGQLTKLGEITEELMRSGASWIHRRKESVTILDEKTLERRMSVDLGIPVAGLPEIDLGGDERLVLVPAFFLEKASARFTAFDFEDETGTSLPLPTKQENSAVSAAVLLAAALRVLGPAALDDDNELRRDILGLAALDAGDAIRWGTDAGLLGHESAQTSRQALRKDDDFPWLAGMFARSSITVVPLRNPKNGRKIIKLSYRQRIKDFTVGRRRIALRSGWSGYDLGVTLPFIGAGSYHFEAHTSEGLEIIEAGISASSGKRMESQTIDLYGSPRVHLYLPHAERLRRGTGRLRLRVDRHGFLFGATFASGLVAAILIACTRAADQIAENATSAPTLLLLLPSVIATYVSRAAGNPLTSRLLVWARVLLVVSGLLAFAAATRLVLDPSTNEDPLTGPELRRTWRWFAGGSVLMFIMLVWSYIAPMSPRVRQDLGNIIRRIRFPRRRGA